MSGTEGWIGVDLDGTLAHYEEWVDETHIGEPIPKMLDRVKRWLSEGKTVKIFTARVAPFNGDRRPNARTHIEIWSQKHLGQVLEVTHEKDYQMVELWDDRAVQVIPNTGKRADGLEEPWMS